eukprot:2553986-Pleurochrysis_carterae.AAC.2
MKRGRTATAQSRKSVLSDRTRQAAPWPQALACAHATGQTSSLEAGRARWAHLPPLLVFLEPKDERVVPANLRRHPGVSHKLHHRLTLLPRLLRLQPLELLVHRRAVGHVWVDAHAHGELAQRLLPRL